MTTQLVGSATLGSQSAFGSQLVENVAQGAAFAGLMALQVANAVVSLDQLARSVTFDFQDTQEWAGRFDFTPLYRPLVPGGVESTNIGEPVVTNVAQGAMLVGMDLARYGGTRVSFDQVARQLLLDLTVEQQASLAQQFNFGGPNVVSARSWDSASFGEFRANLPQSTSPVGIAPSARGTSLVSFDVLARNVVFDMTAPSAASLALHFNFGGASVLVGAGFSASTFGGTAIANLAQGALTVGRDTSLIGTPVTSFDLFARNLVLDFVFAEPSTAGLPVQISFGVSREIQPSGVDTTEWGHSISVRWLIYPDNLDATLYGTAIVLLENQCLAGGLDATEFGAVDFPYFFVRGNLFTAWGQTDIEVEPLPEAQHALFDEGLDSLETAITWSVTNYFQLIDEVGVGWPFTTVSSGALVGHDPQIIRLPHDTGTLRIGTATRVSRAIEIYLLPTYPFSRFGAARVDYPRVFPAGIGSLGTGLPAVVNNAQRIVFDGVRGAVGTPRTAYTQLISVQYYCGPLQDRCGATFSTYTRIENRNKAVIPTGFSSLRMAWFPAGVRLTGKQYTMTGFESHKFNERWEPQHHVGYRVRQFVFGGLDSFYTSQWHYIKNAARVVAPTFIAPTGYGDIQLTRMLQSLTAWGRNSLQVSTALRISDGLQSTTVEYSIVQTAYGTPFVAAGSRAIAPVGWDSQLWPAHTTWQRPPRHLYPYWSQLGKQDAQLIGKPTVANYYKDVFAFGRTLTLWPVSPFWISHYTRAVTPDPIPYVTVFGRATIEFADKSYGVQGFFSTRFSQNAVVWNDPPTVFPPTNRYVIFSGFSTTVVSDDWGWKETAARPDGFDATEYGTAFIYANGILFDSSHSPQQGWAKFGMARVSGGVQTVSVSAWSTTPRPAGESTAYGVPRISPFTIWCTPDAPAQAILNHGREWCVVDAFCGVYHPYYTSSIASSISGPWFGKWTYVTTPGDQHISYNWPDWNTLSKFGNPELTFGTNYFTFDGINANRLGFPVVLGAELRTTRVRNGIDSLEMGEGVAFTILGPRTALPSGFSSLQIPSQQIENLNRSVYVVGLDATLYEGMDYSPYPDAPVIYLKPRGPSDVVGEELTEFGVQWVSHSPRWLYPDGVDSFDTEWTEFQKWMEVWNETTLLFGYSFNDMFEAGTAHVHTGVSYIKPYSIYSQYVSMEFEVADGIV